MNHVILLLIFVSIPLLEYTAITILYKTLSNNKFMPIRDILFIIIVSTEVIVLRLINLQVSIFINCIFIILMLKFIYNETISESIQYFLVIQCLDFIIKFIFNLLIELIQFKFKISSYHINFLAELSLLITIIVICYLLPLKIYYIGYKKMLKSGNFIIFNIIFYIVILKLLLIFNFNIISNYSIQLSIISIIYFFISILFAIYNYKLKEQGMTLKTYEKYSPIVSDLIDDIKSRQHDFKNHINTIYGIIQTTNEKDLKYQLENYITSLNKSLTVLDENISIDHKVVAAIIYVKTNIAKTENINFIYNIDCSLNDIPLQDYELSEILNNLLDNSFKAVKNEAYNNRTVKLKIDSSTTDYLIETENNGLVLDPNKVAKIFNKGFTTKKSVNHGYGLYNVKKIVEFYNGRIQLNVDDGWIKISLYIPR
ncbi:hypothetical protein CPAST_c02090 [Clostridium pasteurianum DSM 525 = ATCC 6013]|uniref:Signal transduction histidine kinase regulating citrate/malate metabolism n=2 Tax=Clostridium pasteurianum TaxID=1501 RepID=A0A0H3IZ51_CLOPA|nr:hypothetical protein CPAST_c02090 [Clostridium pasteurianum DSM 525 = ATCC 6013]AOZ77552.1 hypothetical protein AQ984_01010 [Clostridium pasteurianum]AJA50297.1 hypothetical protein CLPA_c02090 [Clostridium pasteurianum DSM 525 = ATCC 6013]AOZ73755.1 hypothetical protein AQ983_01010 [Clostridium pasteurianum DSM 525 = ATCC 6013]ELP60888.1 hypothetical protein F502_00475 [Clostridium pasteurianum DSM 525 = ATCC 6013]